MPNRVADSFNGCICIQALSDDIYIQSYLIGCNGVYEGSMNVKSSHHYGSVLCQIQPCKSIWANSASFTIVPADLSDKDHAHLHPLHDSYTEQVSQAQTLSRPDGALAANALTTPQAEVQQTPSQHALSNPFVSEKELAKSITTCRSVLDVPGKNIQVSSQDSSDRTSNTSPSSRPSLFRPRDMMVSLHGSNDNTEASTFFGLENGSNFGHPQILDKPTTQKESSLAPIQKAAKKANKRLAQTDTESQDSLEACIHESKDGRC